MNFEIEEIVANIIGPKNLIPRAKYLVLVSGESKN